MFIKSHELKVRHLRPDQEYEYFIWRARYSAWELKFASKVKLRDGLQKRNENLPGDGQIYQHKLTRGKQLRILHVTALTSTLRF